MRPALVALGLAVLVAASGSAFASTGSKRCPKAGYSAYGVGHVRTKHVSCAAAKGFVRTWARSCYGQGKGSFERCANNIPSHPRVVLQCIGTPDHGTFHEVCKHGKYRITFNARP